MSTYLSTVIDETGSDARYDASIKEVLADKQILARILKYSLEEFQDEDLNKIMQSIGQPDISSINVEPGLTNLNKISAESEENSILYEGKIFFDIRFSVYTSNEQIKILVNLEAQKLADRFGLIMNVDTERRINTMCNLSEVRFEQGVEKGIEKERLEIVRKNLMKGKSVEDIADFMDVPVSYVQDIEKALSVSS